MAFSKSLGVGIDIGRRGSEAEEVPGPLSLGMSFRGDTCEIASSWSPGGGWEQRGYGREEEFAQVRSALLQAQRALELGLARAERPERGGVSGTYLICSTEESDTTLSTPCPSPPLDFPSLSPRILGVFKPADEEAGSFSNPHGFNSDLGLGDLLHRTASLFHAGEGAYKEVASYLLDRSRFVEVPQTTLAECFLEAEGSTCMRRNCKVGAFQTYVEVSLSLKYFGVPA